jgi:hypothetical protein
MINKVEILRNYHDHSIVVTLTNKKKTVSGRIIDHSPKDHCILVKDPHLVEYYETKKESFLERIYFKDVKAISYQ